MASNEIGLLDPVEHEHLRRYLGRHEAATVFYDPRWFSVLHDTYGHRTNYWVAQRHGQIVGCLPVTTIRRPLLGTKHIASPYQYHSGLPLGDNDDVRRALVAHAVAQTRGQGGYLEIRHCAKVDWLEALGFDAIDTGLANAAVPLEGLTLSRIREGHRRNVVFAQKSGVSIVEDNSPEALSQFHGMLARESRAMGNPQGGWRFLDRHRTELPEAFHLLLATHDSVCIGGMLTLENRQAAFARYAATGSARARHLYVGKALLWRGMADASARGCASFSLGVSSSRDRGLLQSKEGWGGEVAPVWLHVHPAGAVKADLAGYLDGFQLAKAVWRRLPLALTEPLGTLVTGWVC